MSFAPPKKIEEKELLEILQRSREKAHLLSSWEDNFLIKIQKSYRFNNNSLMSWISDSQTEKLREIAYKLWKN